MFLISVYFSFLLMQVALNMLYTEMLDSASDLLSQTAEEHSSLMKEVCSVSVFYYLLEKRLSIVGRDKV